ncbi:MAG: hypothetical protein WAP51_01510 [Candidatus Sungiibacteriota bacterium]
MFSKKVDILKKIMLGFMCSLQDREGEKMGTDSDLHEPESFVFSDGAIIVEFSSDGRLVRALHLCGADFESISRNLMKIRYVDAGEPTIVFLCPECGFRTKSLFFENRGPAERKRAVNYWLRKAADESWENSKHRGLLS